MALMLARAWTQAEKALGALDCMAAVPAAGEPRNPPPHGGCPRARRSCEQVPRRAARLLHHPEQAERLPPWAASIGTSTRCWLSSTGQRLISSSWDRRDARLRQRPGHLERPQHTSASAQPAPRPEAFVLLQMWKRLPRPAPHLHPCQFDAPGLLCVLSVLSHQSYLAPSPLSVRCPEPHCSMQEEYNVIKDTAELSPSQFWDPVAKQELHWFHEIKTAWLTKAHRGWIGWHAITAEQSSCDSDWMPWCDCRSEHDPLVVRWFYGGLTNAAFNELDRNVLAADHDSNAFISAGDGDGFNCIRTAQVLRESVYAACALTEDVGLRSGDRVAIYLPNDFDAVVWIQAAKRIATPYVAVASATTSRSLASRLEDTAAAAIVTASFLQSAAQEALHFVAPREVAGLVVNAPAALTDGWISGTEATSRTRSQLEASIELSKDMKVATAQHLVRAIWRVVLPLPVDASFPLFILYTSGSTGKPKGIVHTHGGYQVGLCLTSRFVFNFNAISDVFFVIATPGWITGQSYMISAALLCRVESILLDGSPVSPPQRFAETIQRHRVSILKAGSTFLRVLMTMPGGAEILQQFDLSSVRLGTFCAEPVNQAVHQYAMSHVTSNYINSYWATEHGGIVWSRCHGNNAQPVRADTCAWPLPWISGDVLVPSDMWRTSADGEKGEVVIRSRYPYQALTVWQNEGFMTPAWRGDVARWRKYFVPQVGYVQGDVAIRRADGAFTFHGRSDEVINVGGNRIGTEEIESVLLLDNKRADSPLLNCVVVGMADEVLGEVPVVFVVLKTDATLGPIDEGRLRALVQGRLSSVAVPARFIVVEAIPETYSGKFMRRLLQTMLKGAPVGDISAVKNTECIEPLQHAIRATIMTTTTMRHGARTLDMVLDVVCSLTSFEKVSPSTPLMEIGIDSLSVAHFVGELERRTGLPLSPTLIFEHSTPSAVAQHLIQSGDVPFASPCKHVSQSPIDDAEWQIYGCSAYWPSGANSRSIGSVANTGANVVGLVPTYRWTPPSGACRAEPASYLATTRGAELFDCVRYTISQAEAQAMDPQQRKLLEVSYAALHSGAANREQLAGTEKGYFLGITNTDFASQLAVSSSVYAATGSAISVAAGRLSFTFGLHGPCKAVDTACSSSIVALHGSRLALTNRDCIDSLVAAATLMLSPHVSIAYARAGMLSTVGRCKTFDVCADGYVRGEGVGAFNLGDKTPTSLPLSASTVYHDGRSASLTAPNGSAQRAMLATAKARAKLTWDMLESHGTGTKLGDPIEVRAFAHAHADSIVSITGVKANIGHLEPAAGMVGLSQLLYSSSSLCASPNANLRVLNPHVHAPLERRTDILLNGTSTIYSGLQSVAIGAGVSSLGYGGTISHAILRRVVRPTLMSMCALLHHRRRRFAWLDPQRAAYNLSSAVSVHAGSIVHQSATEIVWERQFTEQEVAFNGLHRVGQVPLMPATSFVQLCRAVMEAIGRPAPFAINEATFHAFMFLDKDADVGIRFKLDTSLSVVEIASQDLMSWTTHVQFSVGTCTQRSVEPLRQKESICKRCHRTIERCEFYAAIGNAYQGEYTSMRKSWYREGEVFSHIVFPHMDTEPWLRGSAWLDACTQPGVLFSAGDSGTIERRPLYVASMGAYYLLSPDSMQTAEMWSHHVQPEGADALLRMYNARCACVAEVHGMQFGYFKTDWLELKRAKTTLFEIAWEEAVRVESNLGEQVLFLGDRPQKLASTSVTCGPLPVHTICVISHMMSTEQLPVLDAAMRILQGLPHGSMTKVRLVTSCGWTTNYGAQYIAETAATWGLARVVRMETAVSVGCIDVLTPTYDLVVAALRSVKSDTEELTAYGNTSREPKIISARIGGDSASDLIPWSASGTHMISGGTGGLGMATARWLAQTSSRFSTTFALLSRNGKISASLKHEWNAMWNSSSQNKAQVHFQIESCTVQEMADLQRLVCKFNAKLPITGFWHAAGVLADMLVADQTAQSVCRVYAPKAHGASVFLCSTRASSLQVRVLFSSVSGLLGIRGQSNYAAANVCLDSYAIDHRRRGQHAMSVQWGPWSEVGMASDVSLRSSLRASGFEQLTVNQGTAVLKALLSHRLSTGLFAAVKFRWTALLDGSTFPKILSRIAPHITASGKDATPTAVDVTMDEVLLVAASVSGASVDADDLLVEAGIDSLGAVELRNKLQQNFGVALPSSVLFEAPTARSLLGFLQMDRAEASPRLPTVPVVEDGVTDGITQSEPVSEEWGPELKWSDLREWQHLKLHHFTMSRIASRGEFEVFRVFLADSESYKMLALVRFGQTFESYPGFIHGGVTAAIVDDLAAMATIVFASRKGVVHVTSSMKVSYLKPVPPCTVVVVRLAMVVDRTSSGSNGVTVTSQIEDLREHTVYLEATNAFAAAPCASVGSEGIHWEEGSAVVN